MSETEGKKGKVVEVAKDCKTWEEKKAYIEKEIGRKLRLETVILETVI